MNSTRRGFLAGMVGLLAAPAIVRVVDPIFVRRTAAIGAEVYAFDLVDLINQDVAVQLRRNAEWAFRRYEQDRAVILSPLSEPTIVFDTARAQHTALFTSRVIGYAA